METKRCRGRRLFPSGGCYRNIICSILCSGLFLLPINTSRQPVHIGELECLVENVYHEARGEPFGGQLAVALVTINRASDSICKAVYAKYQFSWTNHKHKAHPRIEGLPRKAALLAMTHVHNFPATHYHAASVRPGWRNKLTKVTVIGNHIFYE